MLDDADTVQSIWDSNPLLRQYLGTPDNPMLIIYKIIPEQVRFMREWALEYHEVVGLTCGGKKMEPDTRLERVTCQSYKTAALPTELIWPRGSDTNSEIRDCRARELCRIS